jgi:hypothetical protein
MQFIKKSIPRLGLVVEKTFGNFFDGSLTLQRGPIHQYTLTIKGIFWCAIEVRGTMSRKPQGLDNWWIGNSLISLSDLHSAGLAGKVPKGDADMKQRFWLTEDFLTNDFLWLPLLMYRPSKEQGARCMGVIFHWPSEAKGKFNLEHCPHLIACSVIDGEGIVMHFKLQSGNRLDSSGVLSFIL